MNTTRRSVALALGACAAAPVSARARCWPSRAGRRAHRATSVKLGFVTKFPVDFFFTLEDAAKAWDEAHPEAEVLFAPGPVRHR